MLQKSTIRLIPSREIDNDKWDDCLHRAHAPIYTQRFYLDAMSRHWSAFVMNDYEAVMPVCWNRKFGISYLYQPFLTPRGGVFASNVTPSLVESFLDAMTARFEFAEINLNASNWFEQDKYPFVARKNYELPLRDDFPVIASRFNDNLLRNYKKAQAAGCVYQTAVALTDTIALAEDHLSQYTKLLPHDLTHFTRLCEGLIENKMAETAGVWLNDVLIASCIFFYHDGRAYYILAGNHHVGKANGASHFLLHEYIRSNAGRDLVLDFTGSDIPGVAFFYECLGATAVNYPSLRINNLPWWLRWAKK